MAAPDQASCAPRIRSNKLSCFFFTIYLWVKSWRFVKKSQKWQPVPCPVSSNIPLPVNCVKVIILTQTRNFFYLQNNHLKIRFLKLQKARKVVTEMLTNPLISPFSPSILPSEVDPPACVMSWRKVIREISSFSWESKEKHVIVQFGPLIMPGHKTLFVGNYILGTWSSSCPPPGVKLTSFKVNNWLQFVASEKWRAHQEIIVRGAGLGLVAGAGHPSRPLHPFPLLHQDQLQVITQH